MSTTISRDCLASSVRSTEIRNSNGGDCCSEAYPYCPPYMGSTYPVLHHPSSFSFTILPTSSSLLLIACADKLICSGSHFTTKVSWDEVPSHFLIRGGRFYWLLVHIPGHKIMVAILGARHGKTLIWRMMGKMSLISSNIASSWGLSWALSELWYVFFWRHFIFCSAISLCLWII